MRILGKQENIRVMQLALFQGIAKKHRAAATIEMKASENPVLQNIQADPTIVCTSFKKNRFYMVRDVLGEGHYGSAFSSLAGSVIFLENVGNGSDFLNT